MYEMDKKCQKCKNNGKAICNRCDMYYDEFDPIDEPIAIMDECKVCANADNEYCFACDNGNQFKTMTNGDRIRAMSDEELAAYYFTEFFRKVPYCHENCPAHDDCQMCLLDWLREETKQ